MNEPAILSDDVPSLLSGAAPGNGEEPVNILRDLAGAVPARRRGGHSRRWALPAGAAVGATGALVLFAAWLAEPDAAPMAGIEIAAAVAPPAGSGVAPPQSAAEPPPYEPAPNAAELSAVIRDMPPADPSSAPVSEPAMPVATPMLVAAAPVAAPASEAVRQAAKPAPKRSAKSTRTKRPAKPAKVRRPAQASRAAEPDVDVITAIVQHTKPQP